MHTRSKRFSFATQGNIESSRMLTDIRLKRRLRESTLNVKNVARKVDTYIKFYARRFIHLVSCLSSDNDTCYYNVKT